MPLGEQQTKVLDQIITICRQRGLNDQQTRRVASAAFLESGLNPDATSKAKRNFARGLFQYQDDTWNAPGTKYSGDRYNVEVATNAFITDMLKYENFRSAKPNHEHVKKRIDELKKAKINPSMDNYILYRHNTTTEQTKLMADIWKEDKGGVLRAIAKRVTTPNYVPGPFSSDSDYGLRYTASIDHEQADPESEESAVISRA